MSSIMAAHHFDSKYDYPSFSVTLGLTLFLSFIMADPYLLSHMKGVLPLDSHNGYSSS